MKKKKKKKKKNLNLAKELSAGDEAEKSSSRSRSRDAITDDDTKELQAGRKKKVEEGEDDNDANEWKTESERRFEEAQRKKLLKLAEKPGVRPELLKTHKQRVEELNTYLSRLSEHHDMPKIGPG